MRPRRHEIDKSEEEVRDKHGVFVLGSKVSDQMECLVPSLLRTIDRARREAVLLIHDDQTIIVVLERVVQRLSLARRVQRRRRPGLDGREQATMIGTEAMKEIRVERPIRALERELAVQDPGVILREQTDGQALELRWL